ncbi:MAG TPA: TonB-dependent receptor, partial [Hyphomonadaceae bacterium]|nr:TonB-dependent receptor [Hyphomonadaceae bacterium]
GQVFPLPGDAFQADEMRAEAFSTLTWKPSGSFNAELGARYEWSRISSDVGSIRSEKTLSYFKPRFAVSWSPKENHQFTFSVERLVDQLSFGAFASSASFENSVFGIGNADIEPEKHWVYEGRFERQFGGQNSFVAKVGHRVTEDVLGRVIVLTPITPGAPPTESREVTMNLDEATRSYLDLAGNFELDRFGMKGGIVNLSGQVRDSETVDPVTGVTRRVSGDTPYSWNFSLQQTLDNGNFRWALFVEDDDDYYNYSPRSFGKQAQLMFIGANITWKPIPGWTFGAGVNNILKNGSRGWSVFYSDGRDIGVPLYLQNSAFEGATNFFANLRRNF